MIQGTGSDVGKSIIVAGLCRVIRRRGITVAPFKPQNMSNNAAACPDGGEIGRAQALQAKAAGVKPTVDLNPVLLKPQSDCTSQVVVHGKVISTLEAAEYMSTRDRLLTPVMESFEKLMDSYDFVCVEGAGSAAETNLRERDIANMGFARRAGVPVSLLADIDRGGVIASIVGTKAVLDPKDSALIRSFIINRFRGNVSLFDEGVSEIEHRTGWPCRGVIPWLDAARRLPQEDAVILDSMADQDESSRDKPIKIVVPMFSRIANSDDFDPLRLEPRVQFEFIPPGRPLPLDADVMILPGTKSTVAELEFMRSQGWDHDVIAHARNGGRVLGMCGGYQMMGKVVRDPKGIDGTPGEAPGLGLLDVETDMYEEKSVRPILGACNVTTTQIEGYEIHVGKTHGRDTVRPFADIDGNPDGAVSVDGKVAGCYLHGIFSSDEFRKQWLNQIREGAASEYQYEVRVEQYLDGVADGLEESLDIDSLLSDAEV